MKKTRLVLLSTIVILASLTSLFAMGQIKASSPTRPSDPLFTYTAKWICYPAGGQVFIPSLAESIGLTPGEYKTDINVHNPTSNPTLNLTKKFVLSIPEAPIVNATTVAFSSTLLLPDGAFRIDCKEILSLLGLPTFNHPFKGFVILTTNASNLDVVAEYSSEAFSTTLSGPGSLCFLTSTSCTPEGIALDLEHIEAVAVPTPICTPGSTISISPSTLNIPVGSVGIASIVIANTGCTPISECFTVTAPAGVTASIIPICVSPPPGGSASATISVVCTTAGTFPVVITATSVTPPIVQTATLTVIC